MTLIRTGRTFRVMGFDIPEYRSEPDGPYSLVVIWNDGRETIQARGHSPMGVREAESTIARNPRVISRIELRDSGGLLETIWRKPS